MKTTLTDFQRRFRRAREAADRGESVLIDGEGCTYVFEKAPSATGNPFAGLEGVFGAVVLPGSSLSLKERVRARIHAKNDRR